ncbi:RagB/SusD family nutrient uptake outer membrane protein [Olivibacter sp. CPCC 100613]|uniref:RagB/SusD family nutrient uptake outer membrane protein n=1 Tax=Olivibacter sp. CPCC 100613 TaxID=3079931 RepID=UPI002FF617D5
MMTLLIIKNRLFRPFLFLFGLLFLLLACQKKSLELAPVTSISEVDAYSTPEKMLAQVNGLYGQLSNASYFGGRHLVFNEQRGDEFSQNDGNNSTGANVWNQSISASGDFVNAVWTAAYRTINSANILLERLESQTFLSEELKIAYTAEAKFVRAFTYFSLVQTYAKPYNQDPQSLALPLRLNAEVSGGNNDLAFSTVQQVYDQILQDLDAAEEGLPTGYSSALLNISRAHKASAIALKTRVYLTLSDWGKLIAEAAKLVPDFSPYQYSANNIVHQLEGDVTQVFGGSYIGSEAIFSIPFVIASEAPGQQAALAYNYLSPVLYLNEKGIASHEVFADPSSTDRRKQLLVTNANNQKLLNKFPHNSAPYLDYIPLIRYAEVLLNYAEALAQTGDLSRARELLYAIRHRSDPGYNFNSGVVGSQELVETIYTEKRIEFLGEGFRSWELFRKGLPLPAKQGNAGTAPEISPDAVNYVWPIPSSELAYNKLAPR